MSTPAPADQYRVSIVIGAFNASATLGRALDSALRQTHPQVEVIVVDDASTDGTLAVARQYAARDGRVRIIGRESNSGGVGAPRNNGIAVATGQYLMFLDADDELPHKACESLLQSALATGAEITAGRALRVNLAKDEVTVWQPQLYGTTRTVEGGLRVMPELFDDPIAAAKLYRLDFLLDQGIRFPEELYFEDTYFSTVAWYCARMITLLPVPVYRWIWERESDAPSITNRRGELRSIRDRVLVHQYADAFCCATARGTCWPTRRRSSSRTTCGCTPPNSGRVTPSSGRGSPTSSHRTCSPCRSMSTISADRWSASARSP